MGKLKKWLDEKWTRPNGEPCGTSPDTKNPQKCRPSKKIDNSTPVTWGELSESDKKKAIREKQEANRKNKQVAKTRFSRIKEKVSH